MFWKKQKNLELENYIMDLEDRVRNLKRRIHEANVKMGFTEDKKTRIEPQVYVRPSDTPRSDLEDLRAKLSSRR